MRNLKSKFVAAAITAFLALAGAACPSSQNGPGVDGTDKTAATVNGTPIMLQEVERAIKATAQGQESKLSPMELAQARLQVLQQLIQQEVMYQKAEKEQTVPKDEDVVIALNKMKDESGLSKEEFEKRMKDAGQTEETVKEGIKKEIATQKLVDKITGKIDVPTDAEINGFYAGNKEFFVKKRGVELAAIVVDPSNSGQGDTTTNEAEAGQRIKEIAQQLQSKVDFATVAREKSEDQSAIRGGDLGNISEEDMKKTFSPQVAADFMNPAFEIGSMAGPIPIAGKFYIFKLKNRIEKDEEQSLETPGVKQQIKETLSNNRKQLLAASYQAIAMNEAKIVNFLAQQVVDNPNELSGARPVDVDGNSDKPAETPADNSNTNAVVNSNAADNTNAAAPSNVNADTKAANSNAADPAKDAKPKQ